MWPKAEENTRGLGCRSMPEVVPIHNPSTLAVSKCWNSIYMTLSKTQKRYEELKAQNPNITILVDEVGPKLKERFFELIELIILENRELNSLPEDNTQVDKRRLSAVDWKYGSNSEFFIRNDLLGTIVAYTEGNDMPRDLVDEISYLIASFAHALPPSFLIHEAIIRPISRFSLVLLTKPSKYSVVLCRKVIDRIEEYPPLWQLFTLNEENSFGRLLEFLCDIPEAFEHILVLFKRLIVLDASIERYLLDSMNVIPRIVDRIVQDYDLVLGSLWSQDQINLFMQTLKQVDEFVSYLSDEGKCRMAQEIREKFVIEHMNPSLRQLKLFDGTVVRSLHFLSQLFQQITSVELCLPIGHCFKLFFFSDNDAETDCLNLTRLLFTEGEAQLSLAVVRMLTSLLENQSKSLLAVFSSSTSQITLPFTQTYEQHSKLCTELMMLIEDLPEQIHDKNTENVNLLYKSHLIAAEKTVPEDFDKLNIVNVDETSMFISLLVKTFDAFVREYWGRPPAENLVLIRFILSLLSTCDMSFCYDSLLGSDEILSMTQAGLNLANQFKTAPLKEHFERPETTRSIARFRANLYSAVHNGIIMNDDMFQGLLDELVDGIESKTVGAVSANVLLYHCFYMRILALIQVQSTRKFKTINNSLN